MKYSKYMREKENLFPEEWRLYLVPYRDLKKYINSVVVELDKSLKQEHHLPDSDSIVSVKNQGGSGDSIETISCSSPTSTSGIIELSAATKNDGSDDAINLYSEKGLVVKDENGKTLSISKTTEPTDLSSSTTLVLKSEQEFYEKIYSSVELIKNFENETKGVFHESIETLSDILLGVTSPYEKDLAIWQKIFELYIEESVLKFEKANELPCEWKLEANSTYGVFLQRLQKSRLLQKLRPRSLYLFNEFDKLNRELITLNILMQLNHTATRKIIKKHNRRTGLKIVSHTLSIFSAFDSNPYSSLASLLHKRFVTVLPYIGDYECPICINVLLKPTRLECGHVMCFKCIVISRNKGNANCPICRHQYALVNVKRKNIDKAMKNMIKLYFPQELRKHKTDIHRAENEELHAMFGIKHKPMCTIL